MTLYRHLTSKRCIKQVTTVLSFISIDQAARKPWRQIKLIFIVKYWETLWRNRARPRWPQTCGSAKSEAYITRNKAKARKESAWRVQGLIWRRMCRAATSSGCSVTPPLKVNVRRHTRHFIRFNLSKRLCLPLIWIYFIATAVCYIISIYFILITNLNHVFQTTVRQLVPQKFDQIQNCFNA